MQFCCRVPVIAARKSRRKFSFFLGLWPSKTTFWTKFVNVCDLQVCVQKFEAGSSKVSYHGSCCCVVGGGQSRSLKAGYVYGVGVVNPMW